MPYHVAGREVTEDFSQDLGGKIVKVENVVRERGGGLAVAVRKCEMTPSTAHHHHAKQGGDHRSSHK